MNQLLKYTHKYKYFPKIFNMIINKLNKPNQMNNSNNFIVRHHE